jgi:hypothetical protein
VLVRSHSIGTRCQTPVFLDNWKSRTNFIANSVSLFRASSKLSVCKNTLGIDETMEVLFFQQHSVARDRFEDSKKKLVTFAGRISVITGPDTDENMKEAEKLKDVIGLEEGIKTEAEKKIKRIKEKLAGGKKPVPEAFKGKGKGRKVKAVPIEA